MEQRGCGVWLVNGWWRDCAGGVAGWEGPSQLWGVALGLHVGLPVPGRQPLLLPEAGCPFT